MGHAKRIAVLASGRGTDLQSLLDAADEGRIESRVVVVASDDPGAKALDRARSHDAAAVVVEPDTRLKGDRRRRDHDRRMAAAIDEHRPDLVVLAGYMRILSARFVQSYDGRLINIHPALLPSFPGIEGPAQAVRWGVRVTGCTTHFVDEKVDHGPIILQAAVTVGAEDTEEDVARRVLALEHEILPRTVHLWEQGRLRIDGRRVLIDPDQSWSERYPTIPGVLYGPGY
jgi:phosphoribosylglycinamide formyltransferase-1